MAGRADAPGTYRADAESAETAGRLLESAYSPDILAARIVGRHRDRIRIKKPHLAAANVARIVDAALKLSNTHGFHAMTLRQLAAESGLSMGALYSCLDSKDTLLLMILGEVAAAVEEVLGSAPAEIADDPARHLAWLIARHVALSEAMQPWFVFAYMEAKAFPPAARRRAVDSERRTEAILAEAIAEGVRQGVFAADDPLFAAALVKPLLQDWYVKRGKHRARGIGAADYAARVTRFVLGALAPVR